MGPECHQLVCVCAGWPWEWAQAACPAAQPPPGLPSPLPFCMSPSSCLYWGRVRGEGRKAPMEVKSAWWWRLSRGRPWERGRKSQRGRHSQGEGAGQPADT